ncbi:hypothetical protein AOQ84DRAFT_383097 [Glonium stellatum]|uniref:Uncharacterized protein n=1 Tax=Glonium stellatum TaxID=574774 RepID=A0A8E2JLZ4_9PEZI|nr:hypothetical protein AOQ84DRAFT_383097 [Glonium stellatum]
MSQVDFKGFATPPKYRFLFLRPGSLLLAGGLASFILVKAYVPNQQPAEQQRISEATEQMIIMSTGGKVPGGSSIESSNQSQIAIR